MPSAFVFRPPSGLKMTKPTGTEKSTYIRAMFDKIAQRYDLMNALMTLGQHQNWRRAAARLAQPPRDGLALDLATGTGDFARALREIESTCRVVGVDFALEMMRLGQEKLNGRATAQKSPSPVAFIAGDMLRLPLSANCFDCAVNGFVLRNVEDAGAAFREMHRVLKPNGRAVSLEITAPRAPLWQNIFSLYFDHAMPRVGGWLSGQPEAYRYLPQSVRDFLSPDAVIDLMRAAGFRGVFYRLWALGTIAVYVGVK